MTDDETIFALSSARGRAGVAVVRLSGPGCRQVVERLTKKPLPQPRVATLRQLRQSSGQQIDRGLVIWFPGPFSFTGEDCAEFHLHGSLAVLNAFAAELAGLPAVRPAEPGEFTRRAFANGKIDLTEAEGLADLIAAETEQQRQQALRQLEGTLGKLYNEWRARLINIQAYLEASIDFSDEELPSDLLAGHACEIQDLLDAMQRHLADGHRGELVREGFTIVILGAPNVGKSSLLNALARRDVAIVSPIPGTTRDTIEVRLDLGGYAVTVIDTAGLRETTDPIEREGIARARAKAAQAGMRLLLLDSCEKEPDSRVSLELDSGDAIILTKSDLAPERSSFSSLRTSHVFSVSAKTGQGIDALLRWVEDQLIARIDTINAVPITRARHRLAIEQAVAALKRCVPAFVLPSPPLDLIAEDLRLASRHLGRLTGRIDVEDLLDVIFRDFCIGK